MRHLCSFLRLLIITAVLGVASLGGAKPAEATHFRYGHLTWKKVGPLTAEFNLTCAFRRSGFFGTASDGFVAVGDKFSENVGITTLYFDDDWLVDPITGAPLTPRFPPATGAGGAGLTFVAVAIDPIKDYVIGRAIDNATGRDRIRFTYPAPVDDTSDQFGQDAGTPWRPNIFSSARISTLRNNPDDYYMVETLVDMTNNTGSPVSSLPPVIPVRQTGASIFIPAVDPDGNTLQYRLATGFEAAGGTGSYVQPPGVSVDPVTGEYIIPPGLQAGLWTTQVIIEEYDGSGTLIGHSAVDFIFNVLANASGNAPSFVRPPTPQDGVVLTAVVGRTTRFLIQAQDQDGDTITLNTTGAPLGARQIAALPVIGAQPVSQFSWTPTLQDVGAYSITYTAEDARGGFSQTSISMLVIDGIDVREPDGGEFYFVGDPMKPMNIRWDTGTRVRANGVKIEISRDSGATWDPTPITPQTPDTGSFTWIPTGPFTRNAVIRITNLDDPLDFGLSENDFTISDGRLVRLCTDPPAVDIPDNNPVWTESLLNFPDDLVTRSIRVTVDITHPYSGDLEVELEHPDGTRVLLHDETGGQQINLQTTYGYGAQYTAPAEALTQLYGKRSNGVWKLRVRDLNPGDIGVLNSWCLEVIGPDTGRFTVVQPNGGERWAVATSRKITWTSQNVVGTDADIQISRNSGANWTTIATVPVAAGEYNWLITGPETTHARVRVVSTSDPVQVDDSDGDFLIQNPFMKVLLPNGGESVSTGQVFQIRWDAAPLETTENVVIELSKDSGGSWSTIATVPNSGSYNWTPTLAHKTDQGRIRITAQNAPPRQDTSDADFKVQEPAFKVLEPAAGDVWYTYTTHTIRWNQVGITGNVNIEVSRDAGRTWELVILNTANDGTEDWVVTGPSSDPDPLDQQSRALVRVVSVNNPTLFGQSSSFTIKEMKITVTSPNGNEVFGIGSTQTITWTSDGVPGNVDIQVSRDGGKTFTTIAANVPNGGSRNWVVDGPITTVPPANTPGAAALIRVKATGFLAQDESDAVFSIISPTVTVVSPTAEEELRVGDTTTLRWTTSGVPGRVRIDLSRDGGAQWQTLFTNTANDGTEQWTVTGPDTTQALIRVSSADIPGVSGQNAEAFTIVTPGITVTSPNGGQTWFTGETHTIQWSAKGFDGGVRIELTRNGGSTWETLFTETENDGIQEWAVSGQNANNARIRVTALSKPSVTDQSDGPFSIVEPSISVGTPNGGQLWLVGTTQTITWRSVGVTGNVDIELSLDNGATWSSLFENTPNDGAQAWRVTGAVSTSARIRVSWNGRNTVSDVTDSAFTIAQPSIRVTSPANKTQWHLGTRETITWDGTAVSAGGTVDIELSRNNGKSYQAIIQDATNDGSVTWLVTGKTANKCKLRVIWKPIPTVSGTSGGTFMIKPKKKVRRGR